MALFFNKGCQRELNIRILQVFRIINRLLQRLSSMNHRGGAVFPSVHTPFTDVTIIIEFSHWYVVVGGSARSKYACLHRICEMWQKSFCKSWTKRSQDCSQAFFSLLILHMLTFLFVFSFHRFQFPDPPAHVSSRGPSGFGSGGGPWSYSDLWCIWGLRQCTVRQTGKACWLMEFLVDVRFQCWNALQD